MFPRSPLAEPHTPSAHARRWYVLTSLLALLALAASGCGRKNTLAPVVADVQGGAATGLTAPPIQPLCQNLRALHLEGRGASGALWVIDRPARWNGNLVVYVHGYTNPSDPVALPDNAEVRDSLLARGFAVAASSFSSNGYAVAEGVRESHELNRIFERRAGHARHTYLMGKSLGGLIGMLLTQKYPEEYDGSLLVSGVVGGSDDEVQYMGDIRVLFDTVYGPVLGGDLYHPVAVTDINAQVVLPVLKAVNANPNGVGIIQALARRPLPGATPQEVVTSLVNMLGFSVQGGGDLFTRTHGHSYFDNATWHYDSSALPAALVADINARVPRYTLEPEGAAFLARWGEPAGPFRIPVVTMHTTRDPIVPVFHEDLLARVAAGPNLRQYQTERYGHVQFSVGEMMVKFDELVRWAGARHHLFAGHDNAEAGVELRQAS
jgi:pimeloyl-ACP methyl ester carboxylesterase